VEISLTQTTAKFEKESSLAAGAIERSRPAFEAQPDAQTDGPSSKGGLGPFEERGPAASPLPSRGDRKSFNPQSTHQGDFAEADFDNSQWSRGMDTLQMPPFSNFGESTLYVSRANTRRQEEKIKQLVQELDGALQSTRLKHL